MDNHPMRALYRLLVMLLSLALLLPAFAKDPWLDPLREKTAFTKLLAKAETQHLESAALFARVEGARTLRLG